MDRFVSLHVADPRENAGRDEVPHGERDGHRVAGRRNLLTDRFAGSPYRDGDVDERQRVADGEVDADDEVAGVVP